MKILIFFLISFNLLVSCGKKGDPEFKQETLITQNKTII